MRDVVRDRIGVWNPTHTAKRTLAQLCPRPLAHANKANTPQLMPISSGYGLLPVVAGKYRDAQQPKRCADVHQPDGPKHGWLRPWHAGAQSASRSRLLSRSMASDSEGRRWPSPRPP